MCEVLTFTSLSLRCTCWYVVSEHEINAGTEFKDPQNTSLVRVSTLAPWIGRQTVVHAAPSTRLQGLQGVQGPLQLYTRRAVCALHASRIDL